MSNTAGRRIVGFDVISGIATLLSGGTLTVAIAPPPNAVPVGLAVALLTAGLAAAAERSRLGAGLLIAVGGLSIVALAVLGGRYAAFLPIVILGIGAGSLCNRICFGVVGSIPERRLERERSTIGLLDRG